MSFNLHTEAKDKINGTVYATRQDLLDAVRGTYGPICDFDLNDGYITDGDGEVVATFGEN